MTTGFYLVPRADRGRRTEPTRRTNETFFLKRKLLFKGRKGTEREGREGKGREGRKGKEGKEGRTEGLKEGTN
jgi:hypothetical protein